MITLYHGTSIQNANKIMQEGFTSRKDKGNWKEEYISKEDFVYFTSAYPFFYGSNASEENDKQASVIKIEIEEKYLYPDEDFIIQAGSSAHIPKNLDLERYKHHGIDSLNRMGNVAIKDLDKIKIISRKDFDIIEMALWCDPCMSIMNFMIMGEYYKNLVSNWFSNKEWKMSFEEFLNNNNNKTRKEIKLW